MSADQRGRVRSSIGVAARRLDERMPLGAKLIVAIALLLIATWTVMIYLAYEARRSDTAAEARDFAQSVHQMTVAAITGNMISGIKDNAIFLDQVKQSSDVADLVVIPAEAVAKKHDVAIPAGAADAAAKAVLATGKPSFVFDADAARLSAVMPILNARDYLGKNCVGCHEGDGDVLGVVSLKVKLDRPLAELRSFTWRIALVGTALTVPLLGMIYWFVRRFVTRPLGGEPREAVAIATAVAAGDLSRDLAVPGNEASIVAALARMQSELAGIIREIHTAADAIRVAAKEVAAGSLDLSQRTEEQASSLQETAAALEELTSVVGQNAGSAQTASDSARGTCAAAEEAGRAAEEAVHTMTRILDSSNRMAEIIAVVDSIAFQTNILALNAAVEAARAGEQGRGFAVVASEVRNLAQRSASAAKEIKALINETVEAVGGGKALVDRSGASLRDVIAGIENLAGMVTAISRATAEQSSGIEQINEAVMQMDRVTQQNAALVEEAAAAADSMHSQADQLVRSVSVFKLAQAGAVPRQSSHAATGRGAKAQPAANLRVAA